MGKAKIGEWMWRFLAAVMLFAVGWTLWIYHQLNLPPLVMNAAFEAAAKARVNAGQSSQGVIAPATVPVSPKEPSVDAGKLKFSESLSVPEKK
jgi:hypothetical protein